MKWFIPRKEVISKLPDASKLGHIQLQGRHIIRAQRCINLLCSTAAANKHFEHFMSHRVTVMCNARQPSNRRTCSAISSLWRQWLAVNVLCSLSDLFLITACQELFSKTSSTPKEPPRSRTQPRKLGTPIHSGPKGYACGAASTHVSPF